MTTLTSSNLPVDALFPNDKGITQKMNRLKMHWSRNSLVWSDIPVCGQVRLRGGNAEFLPVRVTDNMSELTCEKCIAAVVGNQFLIGWTLDRIEAQEREAGKENRTTCAELWNNHMYALPYGTLAVFSFLPIEHPARTQEPQAVGYANGWAHVKTQKQPARTQNKVRISEKEIAFGYYRITWSDGSTTDEDRLIVTAHTA